MLYYPTNQARLSMPEMVSPPTLYGCSTPHDGLNSNNLFCVFDARVVGGVCPKAKINDGFLSHKSPVNYAPKIERSAILRRYGEELYNHW